MLGDPDVRIGNLLSYSFERPDILDNRRDLGMSYLPGEHALVRVSFRWSYQCPDLPIDASAEGLERLRSPKESANSQRNSTTQVWSSHSRSTDMQKATL